MSGGEKRQTNRARRSTFHKERGRDEGGEAAWKFLVEQEFADNCAGERYILK